MLDIDEEDQTNYETNKKKFLIGRQPDCRGRIGGS